MRRLYVVLDHALEDVLQRFGFNSIAKIDGSRLAELVRSRSSACTSANTCTATSSRVTSVGGVKANKIPHGDCEGEKGKGNEEPS